MCFVIPPSHETGSLCPCCHRMVVFRGHVGAQNLSTTDHLPTFPHFASQRMVRRDTVSLWRASRISCCPHTSPSVASHAEFGHAVGSIRTTVTAKNSQNSLFFFNVRSREVFRRFEWHSFCIVFPCSSIAHDCLSRMSGGVGPRFAKVGLTAPQPRLPTRGGMCKMVRTRSLRGRRRSTK